jgi:drug/metabolite transporter (DMT)-like permease
MAFFILVRVLLSVTANAVQKRLLLDRAGVGHTWVLTYLMMLVPALIWAIPLPQTPGFWWNVAVGGGLDALGNLAMVAALRSTDISVFGPLNALRPILALIFGWIFLAETPTTMGLAGIAVTVIGGVILFSENSEARSAPPRIMILQVWKAVLLRTLGLGLGVVGAVFLKRAATMSTAESTVAGWIACGLIVLVICGSFRPFEGAHGVSHGQAFRLHWKWLTVHAVVFLAMQWLTVRIFQETLLAYSFVFFQLGMLLQVFVGRFFFQEKSFLRRLVAATVMAAGSVLILWKG